MLQIVFDFLQHHEKFGEQCFEGGAIAVIGVNCRDQRIPVFMEHARELLQVGTTSGIIRHRIVQAGGSLARKTVRQLRRDLNL